MNAEPVMTEGILLSSLEELIRLAAILSTSHPTNVKDSDPCS